MRQLLKDGRGNVAITFALALIPICILLGGSIDFSRAMTAKNHLRDTLDAAALAIGATPNFTQADAQKIADDFSKANYPAEDIGAPPKIDSVVFTTEDVTISGSATLPTTMLGLIAINTLKVTADVTVKRAGVNVEAALVLDTTGSMLGQKMTDMKTAAKDFVDAVVQTDQTPYYSKVAIIPFSQEVNLGSAYANLARGAPTAGTCTTPGCANYKFNRNGGGTYTWPITNCVSERTGANAYTDTAPSAAPVGRVYTSTGNCAEPTPIVPLSSNKTALKNTINSLVASGGTAGQIGTAWGWYMLSPKFSYMWPASSQPGAYNDKKIYKNLVIMTDGDYNYAYCNGVYAKDWGGQINCNATNGDPTNQAKQLCTNAKAAGITLYTIGFQVSGASKTFLTGCATSAGYAYFPTTGSELKEVFKNIAKSINSLKIAH